MNQKIQLPLFIDPYILPTGKFHLSFSEISDFIECSYRHKLKYVDKLGMDGASIHTAFGNVIHGALEKYTLTGNMPSVEECTLDFQQRLGELLFTEKAVTAEDAKEFIDCIGPMLEQVPGFLDENFPSWKIISAEEKLFEPIEGQTNKYFKGFIDLVIKVPKIKKGKTTRLSGLKGETVPDEWIYYLLDWKTSNFGWQAAQKRSFEKQMQLVLYKYFWCKKMGVDLKDARCAFAFLKRKARKDGSRTELLPVSVGPRAVEKALIYVHSALNQIQSGRYVKNKMSCRFCSYSGTRLCP